MNAVAKPAPLAATPATAAADPAGLPLFGWWTGLDDEVGGAFMHTPPHPLLLTAVPAGAAAELAAALAGRRLGAVNAYPDAAWPFAAEVRDEAGEDHEAAVRDRLGYGGISLWQAAGRPVSMGAVTRPVAGMVRIGPVYTPPEFRGAGYASAVTAELSLRAREAGAAEVLLYTDLDNPVSNSIYQRIGYRAVEDRVVLTFSPPGATGR